MLLVVDHLGACADVPDTDTPLIVAGGQLILVVRIEEHRAGECEKVYMATFETGKILAEQQQGTSP